MMILLKMGQHEQHKKEFIKELNSVNNVNKLRFVRHDKKIIYGKYKGLFIMDVPINYINFVLKFHNITDDSKFEIEQEKKRRLIQNNKK